MVEANAGFNAEVRGRGLFIGLDCKPAAYGNEITRSRRSGPNIDPDSHRLRRSPTLIGSKVNVILL